MAVFIVVFVGSYNDYKKEDQFFKLYALDQEGKYVSDSLFNKAPNEKWDLNLKINEIVDFLPYRGCIFRIKFIKRFYRSLP